MSAKKVIEILCESPDGWEAAAQKGLEEVSKTVRNIHSIYIKEMEAKVEDSRIVSYRLNCKVTFTHENK